MYRKVSLEGLGAWVNFMDVISYIGRIIIKFIWKNVKYKQFHLELISKMLKNILKDEKFHIPNDTLMIAL